MAAAVGGAGGIRAVGDRGSRPGPHYALPAFVFFSIFAVFPMLLVVYLSLTSWDGIVNPAYIGLDNWSRLLSDGAVTHSLRVSALLTVLGWCVQTPISLLLGVWAAGRQRNRALLSSLFFLPLLLSSAAITLAWLALLDPNFGLAATLGPYIGFEDGNILGSAGGALISIVVVVSWQFVPFHMLLYQAGARQIPRSLYEAAVIDGANRVKAFWHITLPQLRHTIVTSSTIMIVGSLTYFETVLILTNGGPGGATNILPFRMYESAFRSYEMGYASAIATGLVVIGTALSLLIVRFSGFASMRSTLEGV
jgi:xylobiose transport system permease protein